MLPGMELMGCTDLAVPAEVMHHVVRVESSYNPYAIGVVGGRLVRQPRNLPEAVATAQMLESRGYNFSLGLAQVNRYNLKKYGIDSYSAAFQTCPNLIAGARILAECHSRAKGDWGDSLSCYYSGNFVTGYRHGYVQKIFASMNRPQTSAISGALPIEVATRVQPTPGRAMPTGASIRSQAMLTPDQRMSNRTSSNPGRRSDALQGVLAVGADPSRTAVAAAQSAQPSVVQSPEAAFQAQQTRPASGVEFNRATVAADPKGAVEEVSTPDSAFVF